MTDPMRHLHLYSILCLSLLVGCTRFDVLNAMVPTGDHHTLANISFGPDPRQKLDVYEPINAKPGKSIVVFFYGGYWQHGNKADYRFVGQALTSQNFIAIVPDYRLYPSVTFPAFVQDGALAVRWAHDNAGQLGGDPTHIYLMGHSAGAYIAAMIALDPKYLQAVGLNRCAIRAFAGLAGPYEFKIGPELRPAFGLPSTTGPIDPNVEPVTFVDGKQPPMLLLQGADDRTVDPGNSDRLARRIHSIGGQVLEIMYAGKNHTDLVLSLAAPFRWIAPVLRDSASFLRSQ